MNKAGLKDVTIPSCDVAGKAITSGSNARCFAQYMNIHALLATGGYVYAQMGIYEAKPAAPKSQLEPGGGTNNTTYAQTDPKTGQPVQNGARNVWVTETGLATALNVSYMATQLALFSLVVGVALLLSGVGFIVLALAALPRLRARSPWNSRRLYRPDRTPMTPSRRHGSADAAARGPVRQGYPPLTRQLPPAIAFRTTTDSKSPSHVAAATAGDESPFGPG